MTPVRISIGEMTVTAASGIAAGRLAVALPQALADAVLRHQTGTAAPRRPNAATQAAEEILTDILRKRPGVLTDEVGS